MLLTHAQGVSSAIEDAAALEVLLKGVPGAESLSSSPSQKLTERLSLFEHLRLPRVSATQILTEPIVPGPKFMEMAKQAEARIRQYYPEPLPLPPPGAVPHSQPICDFFFGYNVAKEAEHLLKVVNRIEQIAVAFKSEKPKVDVSEIKLIEQETAPQAGWPLMGFLGQCVGRRKPSKIRSWRLF